MRRCQADELDHHAYASPCPRTEDFSRSLRLPRAGLVDFVRSISNALVTHSPLMCLMILVSLVPRDCCCIGLFRDVVTTRKYKFFPPRPCFPSVAQRAECSHRRPQSSPLSSSVFVLVFSLHLRHQSSSSSPLVQIPTSEDRASSSTPPAQIPSILPFSPSPLDCRTTGDPPPSAPDYPHPLPHPLRTSLG